MIAAALLLAATPVPKPLLSWSALTSRPLPAADATLAYGRDPLQHVDLWLPRGTAPHPVVLMVHGGCWQTSVAEAKLMNYAAADLRARGIAVWNIEYRGVDRPGGGYPGTFRDAAAAADALRVNAPRYHLKLDHVVAFGHSAGGHLALWLAARAGLPPRSPLRSAGPLRITTVVSSGGLPDLAAATVPPGDTCGADTIRSLTGGPTAAHPDVYADTSPARLPPPAADIVLVNATRDRIAPPVVATAYAATMRTMRKPVRLVTVPDEGHAELIAPGTAAWKRTVALIEAALGPALSPALGPK